MLRDTDQGSTECLSFFLLLAFDSFLQPHREGLHEIRDGKMLLPGERGHDAQLKMRSVQTGKSRKDHLGQSPDLARPRIPDPLGRVCNPASGGKLLPAGPPLPSPPWGGRWSCVLIFVPIWSAFGAAWRGRGCAPAVPRETGPPAYLICS